MSRWGSSVLLVAALCWMNAVALAEGSAELDTADAPTHDAHDQAVDGETVLFVDVLDGAGEKLCYRGNNTALGVYQPASQGNAFVVSLASGACTDAVPGVNGAYLLDVGAQTIGVPWDIRVCERALSDSDCLNNPSSDERGRLFSYDWSFQNNTQYIDARSINGSVFAIVPGGAAGRNAVIEMQMRGVSGARYHLRANARGPETSGGTRLGRSAPIAGHRVTPEYPLYLNPPAVARYDWITPQITDVSVTPSCGDSVVVGRAAGSIRFGSNLVGQYVLICDVSRDGIYDLADVADFSTFGSTTPGANELRWDGKTKGGSDAAPGSYSCVVRLNVGEFHYIAEDIESAFPGIRMFRLEADRLTRTPLPMFWDDTLVPVDPEAMPDGRLSPLSPSASGLDPGDYGALAEAFSIDGTLRRGNARAWGNFNATSKGNDNYLDQFSSAASTESAPFAIRVVAADADRDADGLSDGRECELGSNPQSADSDGDHVRDGSEATSSSAPDTDRDGTLDIVDPDDDGDGRPTVSELGPQENGDGDPADALDTDRDGIRDYLDADAAAPDAGAPDAGVMPDASVVPDASVPPDASVAPDGSVLPDAGAEPDARAPDDHDSDEDGVPDHAEQHDGMPIDTDSDSNPNHLDPDDDGDGRPTRDERPDGRDADSDNDGNPDHLDPDDTPTQQDVRDPRDAATPGTPPRGSLAGGALCAVSAPGTAQGAASTLPIVIALLTLLLRASRNQQGTRNRRPRRCKLQALARRCRPARREPQPGSLRGSEELLLTATQWRTPTRYRWTKGRAAPAAGEHAAQLEAAKSGVLGACHRTKEREAPAAWLPLGAAMACAISGCARWVRVIGLGGVLAVVCSSRLQAQVALSPFKPAPLVSDGFGLSRPDGLRHLALSATLLLDYANDPLVYELASGDRPQERIVRDHLQLHAALALGLWERLTLFAQLPVHLIMSGPERPEAAVPPADGAGLGDIVLGGRLRLAGDPRSPLALSAELSARLPTADLANAEQRYSGDAIGSYEPALLAELRAGRIAIRARAGVRLRQLTQLGNLALDHELVYGAGLRFRLLPLLHLHAELYGSTFLKQPWQRAHAPLEALLGLKVHPGDFSFGVAAGPGLSHGYGAPDVRIVGLAGYAPQVRAPAVVLDRDRDGLQDAHDRCPDQPEDRDGFADSDGCPDPDNDSDGVLDPADQCPLQPEDREGFEDEDGCPDPDNDADGVLDPADRCAQEPEDRDDFADADGCPDPDNDRDAILDAADKCPTQPEDYDAFEDDDGCPEEGSGLVQLTCEKIEIKETVYFDTGKERIQERSFGLLDQVASVLSRAQYVKRVRVEGHTDDRGTADYNLDLSRRRAAAVLRYLSEHGIAGERLESEGYGLSKPIADNKLEAGRAQNRRVELVVVEQDAEGCSK